MGGMVEELLSPCSRERALASKERIGELQSARCWEFLCGEGEAQGEEEWRDAE